LTFASEPLEVCSVYSGQMHFVLFAASHPSFYPLLLVWWSTRGKVGPIVFLAGFVLLMHPLEIILKKRDV